MKSAILGILALLVLAVPLTARAANEDKVFIKEVAILSNTACAVELEFGEEADPFQLSDNIKLDSQVLSDFTALVNAGINGPDGNHFAGDHILAASPDFESQSGLTAD